MQDTCRTFVVEPLVVRLLPGPGENAGSRKHARENTPDNGAAWPCARDFPFLFLIGPGWSTHCRRVKWRVCWSTFPTRDFGEIHAHAWFFTGVRVAASRNLLNRIVTDGCGEWEKRKVGDERFHRKAHFGMFGPSALFLSFWSLGVTFFGTRIFENRVIWMCFFLWEGTIFHFWVRRFSLRKFWC